MSETHRYTLSPKSLTGLLGERDTLDKALTVIYMRLETELSGMRHVQALASAVLAIEATLARLDREITDLQAQEAARRRASARLGVYTEA